ncbi:MAG: alpha/beta fold hydrolase [Chloroflexota bacterium]
MKQITHSRWQWMLWFFLLCLFAYIFITFKVDATPQTESYMFDPWTIDALQLRQYGSGTLISVEEIEKTWHFKRYKIEYDSDGHLVSGFVNVPAHGENFPVVFVLHGYVDPEHYRLLDYTTTYADRLAEAGYVVFHPSYRYHGENQLALQNDMWPSGEPPFRIGYALDVINLMTLLQEASFAETHPLAVLQSDQFYLMGHSMGGSVAQRVMSIRPDEIKGLVLYNTMHGDEEINYRRIREWGGNRSYIRELAVPPELVEEISPIHMIDSWTAPVTLHYGSDDLVVPHTWSQTICEELKLIDHPTSCYMYDGANHLFQDDNDQRFVQRIVYFFNQIEESTIEEKATPDVCDLDHLSRDSRCSLLRQ